MKTVIDLKYRLLLFVLKAVSFVDGSELELCIAVSMFLSEVSERRCVVIKNGRVVLLQ